MDSCQQPRPTTLQTRGSVAWSRDAASNVVRIHRPKPFAAVALGSCSYHDAALAEEQARPRK